MTEKIRNIILEHFFKKNENTRNVGKKLKNKNKASDKNSFMLVLEEGDSNLEMSNKIR